MKVLLIETVTAVLDKVAGHADGYNLNSMEGDPHRASRFFTDA